MKYFILLLTFTSFGFIHKSFSQEKTIFLGEIKGHPLELFTRNSVKHENSGLPDIKSSPYKIEIRLYEEDALMGFSFCTILYFDTAFKRKAYFLPFFNDSLAKAKEIKILYSNTDSIFQILVRNGIFSIQSLDEDSIKNNYHPKILTLHGLDSSSSMSVDDGASYLLEYKVDTYFDQALFSNSDYYSEYYMDHILLRRQAGILAAIKTGIDYLSGINDSRQAK